jgi:enoyl-CoA hydratase/carnithine racemase
MWDFPKAQVIAVKGFVGPHGNAFLMTADAVVAADNSVFSFEETRIGIGAPYGPYALMAFHFPMRVLKQLWIPGGWMDAATAARLFYVNRVVPLGQEEAEARRIAEIYAGMDLANIVANKRGVHQVYEAAGLGAMIDVGREPYVPTGAAAAEQDEHFRLIHEKGAGAAARSRDSGFDRALSKV